MEKNTVTVFGGSGYLGHCVTEALLAAGQQVRLAARNPQHAHFDSGHESQLQRHAVDIRDQDALADAVADSDAVINAVSLYKESGDLTFDAIHVKAAGRLASAARDAGVQRFVQLSGIGVDPDSPSPYIRARTFGETAVLEAFPKAIIVRPSSLFGADDALISSLALLTRLPLVPLFGRGQMRLQPVWVGDVAEALAQLATSASQPASIYELGGAEIVHYRDLAAAVCRHLGRRRPLVPVPFPVWHALAAALGVLASPPLTRDQLWLVAKDNVVAKQVAGFSDLQIRPRGVREALSICLGPPK